MKLNSIKKDWLVCYSRNLSTICSSSVSIHDGLVHPLPGVGPEMRAEAEFVSTRSFNRGSDIGAPDIGSVLVLLRCIGCRICMQLYMRGKCLSCFG